MTNKKALVVGATGLVGSQLIAQLQADYHWAEIIVLARRPESHPKKGINWYQVDLAQADSWVSHLTGVHDLFCCLGTTMKKAGSKERFRQVDYELVLKIGRAAHQAAVPQLLVISAIGANPNSRVFYNRVKGEMERDLAATGIPRLVVARPSLLIGSRGENRWGEKLAGAVFNVGGRLLRGSLEKYRAIDSSDVARALVALAKSGEPGTHIVESNDLHPLPQ